MKEHDRLLVLEAMKMEMSLIFALNGMVKEVLVNPRERVEGGDLLVVFQ